MAASPSPAFAPVLLNVAIVGFLGVAFLFPNAGEAASWGVVVSGAAQLVACRRGGAPARIAGNAGLAALERGRSAILRRACSRDHRLGRRADRHFRRHDHRLAAADRRGFLDLLRRAPLPIADRRHRRGRGHRVAAGDEPPSGAAATQAAPGTAQNRTMAITWRCRRLSASPFC